MMTLQVKKDMPHWGMRGFIEACIPFRLFSTIVDVPTKHCAHLITGEHNPNMNYAFDLDVRDPVGLAEDLALLKRTGYPILVLCEAQSANSLGDFFIKQGLSFLGTAQGKYRDLNDFSYEPRSEITIREVTTPEMFNTWRDIAATAFAYPRNQDGLLFDNFFGTTAHRPAMKLFLAYLDGQAAGQGMLILGKDVSVNMWSSVLPEFRNRGVLTELLRYRNALAKKAGYTRSVVQCLPSSASIYDKNGYHNAEVLNLYMINVG